MKANELMIGDWVQYLGQLFHVTRIDGGHIYMLCSDGDYEDQHVSRLQQIPITKEILEKNGFYEDKFGAFRLEGYSFDETPILLTSHDNCIDALTIQHCGNYMEVNISYIHELQHALKICKIEKEITI